MRKMNRLIPAVVLFVLGTLFIGCASIPPAPTLGPDSTTAKVYFVMPGSGVTFTGGGLTFGTQFYLWDGDKFISTIGRKESLMFHMKEGTHHLMASGGNWWIIEADLAAGKSYYFEVITLPGFSSPSARLRFIESDDPELDQYMKDSKEILPKGKVSESMVQEAARQLNAALDGSQNIDRVNANQGM